MKRFSRRRRAAFLFSATVLLSPLALSGPAAAAQIEVPVDQWRAGRLLVDGRHAAYRAHPHLFELFFVSDGREGLVMTIVRLLALCCALLALSLPLPARADVGLPPAMSRDAANANLPAARNNLGLVPNLASAVMPGSIAIAGSPTGYAVGEVVTLTCAGCTFITNP